MHVNKLYGLSSAAIDSFPQVNGKAAVKKIPLSKKHHTWTDLELLFSAGI